MCTLDIPHWSSCLCCFIIPRLLHNSLVVQLTEEERNNLTVFGQAAKLFHSKDKLEETVREYMKQLSEYSQLLNNSEVIKFLKYRPFNIHWKDEEVPTSSQ